MWSNEVTKHKDPIEFFGDHNPKLVKTKCNRNHVMQEHVNSFERTKLSLKKIIRYGKSRF